MSGTRTRELRETAIAANGRVDRNVMAPFTEMAMGKFEALCNMLPADVNWGDAITPQIVEQIVLAEREACAMVCETAEVPIDIEVWMGTKKALTAATAIGLATAIRRRSNAL